MAYHNLAHSMYFTANHFSETDEGEYYYSSLNRDQIESREYTSILPFLNSKSTIDNDSELCNELELLSSLEEDFYLNYQSLYTKFTDYVENIETEAFRQLSGFSKTKESKFLTYDQAIEKVLDRINLESNLEHLIKEVANLDKKRESLNHETEVNEENFYYSLANLTSEKKFRTPELLFLEHVFCLIKFSKLNIIMQLYKDLFLTFLEKLTCLIKTSSSYIVISTATIFLSLFKNDWDSVLDKFKGLPPKSKWHVLKNLIYFSFKIALFQLVNLKECGSKTSMSMILNSIYQYVKITNQI